MMQREVSEKVLVNHVHPGYVDTDMTFHKGPDTVEKGAKPIVWAATLPEDSDVKGQFIWKDCSIIDWVATPLPEPVWKFKLKWKTSKSQKFIVLRNEMEIIMNPQIFL